MKGEADANRCSRSHITKRDKDGVAPLASADLEALLKQYKFYLSFENQNCEDYVSEKFFRAIYSGMSSPKLLKECNSV